jgi:single-strand DNA-binding protein
MMKGGLNTGATCADGGIASVNRVIEIGRIATDIDNRTTQGGVSWATFKIAVNRRFKNADGEREADFIPVVVWRQAADYVRQYGHKGDRIAVSGAVQTRTYDAKDGTKRYVTEINADEVELFPSRVESGGHPQENSMQQQGFEEVDDSDPLPF